MLKCLKDEHFYYKDQIFVKMLVNYFADVDQIATIVNLSSNKCLNVVQVNSLAKCELIKNSRFLNYKFMN